MTAGVAWAAPVVVMAQAAPAYAASPANQIGVRFNASTSVGGTAMWVDINFINTSTRSLTITTAISMQVCLNHQSTSNCLRSVTGTSGQGTSWSAGTVSGLNQCWTVTIPAGTTPAAGAQVRARISLGGGICPNLSRTYNNLVVTPLSGTGWMEYGANRVDSRVQGVTSPWATQTGNASLL